MQSVEIEVTGTATAGTEIAGTALYDSIYTLYDKNNYIIASVVLGEAKGGNASYVYTLTAATSEEKLSDGTHQWTFDAIVDGQITTLTARSKFAKTIKDLEPGHIQELRYDGDYVVGVKTPSDTTKYYTDPTNPIDDEEIYDVGHVAAKGAPDCTVGTYRSGSLVAGSHDYNGDGTNDGLSDRIKVDDGFADNLRVVGRTMYLGVGYDYGLTFVENAPAVVIQPEDDGTKKTEYSSVAAAIGALGDPVDGTPEKEYKGRIVAVLNSQGVAKWVVFVSDTPVLSSGVDNTNGNDRIVVDPNANTVEVTTVGDPDGIGSITSRIRKEMERLGYSEIVIEVNSDNEITKISGKRNGVTYTMKQLGAIEVVDPAVALAGDKAAVEAITNSIFGSADGVEPEWTVAQIKSKTEAAVNDALSAGVTAAFTWDDTAGTGTKAAVNGAAVSDNGTAGAAKASVVLSKGGKTETVAIDLTVPAMAYANTNAGKVATAKTAIEAVSTVSGSFATTDAAKTALQTAITAAAGTDVVLSDWNWTVTKEVMPEKDEDNDSNADTYVDTDGDGTADATKQDGVISVTVKVTCGTSEDTATVSNITATANTL